MRFTQVRVVRGLHRLANITYKLGTHSNLRCYNFSPYYLRYHIHGDEVDTMCTECERFFDDQRALQRHVKVGTRAELVYN